MVQNLELGQNVDDRSHTDLDLVVDNVDLGWVMSDRLFAVDILHIVDHLDSDEHDWSLPSADIQPVVFLVVAVVVVEVVVVASVADIVRASIDYNIVEVDHDIDTVGAVVMLVVGNTVVDDIAFHYRVVDAYY